MVRLTTPVLPPLNNFIAFLIGLFIHFSVHGDRGRLDFTVIAIFNSSQSQYSVEENIVDVINTETKAGRLGPFYVSNLIVNGRSHISYAQLSVLYCLIVVPFKIEKLKLI